MQFQSKHNGEVISIEYNEIEAMGDDGLVYQCEVTYQGVNVTNLLGDYEAFLMECQDHFKAYQESELREGVEA
jgi:hypothetical protein